MARVAQAFMDRKDLLWFNDSVNDRIRCRLKYKGDFEITEVQADWDALAPTEIAHVYQLTSASEELKKITINDETYRVGDWVIVMNKTIKNDDGTIVDEDGNPTQVEVRKLGSSGMPDGENDGDGLVFVNGSWELQKDYGYYKPGPETYHAEGLLVEGINIPLPDSFPGLVENVQYDGSIGGRLFDNSFATKDENGNLVLPLDNLGTGYSKLYQMPSGKWCIEAASSEFDTQTVDFLINGELFGEYVQFDERYIPSTLPKEANAGDAMIYNGNEWTRQDNYGFTLDQTNEYTTHTFFAHAGIGKGRADVKMNGLVPDEHYKITIGEDVFEGDSEVDDNGYVVIKFDESSSKLRSVRDTGVDFVSFSSGEDYRMHDYDIVVEGLLTERIFKIDPKYLPEGNMPDGTRQGDGIAYVDEAWRVQPDYGWHDDGRNIASGNVSIHRYPSGVYGEIPFPVNLVVGKEYTVSIDCLDPVMSLEIPKVATVDDNGNPMIDISSTDWDCIKMVNGALRLVAKNSATIEGVDDFAVTFAVEGELGEGFVKFNRGYIPDAVKVKEIIPTDTEGYHEGDLVYVTNQPIGSVVRIKLTDEAASLGYEVTEDGIYKNNGADYWRTGDSEFIGRSWEQLSKMEEPKIGSVVLVEEGEGNVYYVTKTDFDGTVISEYVYSDDEITGSDITANGTVIYRVDSDSFDKIESDVTDDCHCTPIAIDALDELECSMYKFNG